MSGVGSISTGMSRARIRPGNSPSENGSWERVCPPTAPFIKGPCPRYEAAHYRPCGFVESSGPHHLSSSTQELMDPGALSPGPLMPGAEPVFPTVESTLKRLNKIIHRIKILSFLALSSGFPDNFSDQINKVLLALFIDKPPIFLIFLRGLVTIIEINQHSRC